ncbi:MAG: hypothetical protein ABL998_06290 [Planctomycetota bacterium]
MTTVVTAGGARIERRSLFGLCAALGLLPRLGAARARAEEFTLDFDGFLNEAVPLAEELIGDTSRAGQDRYLCALAALAAGLRDVPVPEMNETTSQDSPARTFLGANECEAPFTVLHWRLEPGARIGLHPHLYGNVLTRCLAGEVRVENYELAGVPDFETKEPFQVRRTNDQVLLPGSMNLLNLEHGYVHGFVAGPQGARGLDITTRIKPKRATPTLLVGKATGAESQRLFEARWRHA